MKTYSRTFMWLIKKYGSVEKAREEASRLRKKYYLKNRDKVHTINKRWYDKSGKEYHRQYYKKDGEVERRRRYYLRNLERIKQYHKEWYIKLKQRKQDENKII